MLILHKYLPEAKTDQENTTIWRLCDNGGLAQMETTGTYYILLSTRLPKEDIKET